MAGDDEGRWGGLGEHAHEQVPDVGRLFFVAVLLIQQKRALQVGDSQAEIAPIREGVKQIWRSYA